MSALMEQPSEEEVQQINAFVGKIMSMLYSEEEAAPRHVVIKTLVSCMIGAVSELQDAEDKLTSKVLIDNQADPIEVNKLVKESHMEGWKNKASQIILLFIGHLGNRKTRKDQMDIIRNCLSFMQDISKPDIIEP